LRLELGKVLLDLPSPQPVFHLRLEAFLSPFLFDPPVEPTLYPSEGEVLLPHAKDRTEVVRAVSDVDHPVERIQAAFAGEVSLELFSCTRTDERERKETARGRTIGNGVKGSRALNAMDRPLHMFGLHPT